MKSIIFTQTIDNQEIKTFGFASQVKMQTEVEESLFYLILIKLKSFYKIKVQVKNG